MVVVKRDSTILRDRWKNFKRPFRSFKTP